MAKSNNKEEPTKSLDSTFESIIIDIPQNLTFSSASSSSYDTDSSVNSAMCCTKHNVHTYLQKPLPHKLQQQNRNHLHTLTGDMKSSVANGDVAAVYFKADNRKSWPIFILLISLLETAVFVYNTSTLQELTPKLQDFAMYDNSVFIYRPDRRLEIWRFISYMFLHVNWFHLGFNVVIQLFYGIPLEIMHGSLRVGIIYFAGVFAGSLGTSVVESEVYLLGASGGVYATLAANLANITLNYSQMKFASAQLFSVGIFVFCDLGQALYSQYMATEHIIDKTMPVSYVAHLTGALAGLTTGLLVLKTFDHRAYENLIWWLALGVYCAFTVFAIVFNLINTMTAQRMEEQGKVITQHLLHDLGVS